MVILLQIILLAVGFVMLIKGADIFVDGSSALAARLHVPGVIIGLTIVALGTSAPELAVSTSAALSGSNEIALSNVVGSNIFNLLMVLGVCAVMCNVPVDRVIIKRDLPVSISATVFLLLMVMTGYGKKDNKAITMESEVGTVSRLTALVCLLFFVIYIVFIIIEARKKPDAEEKNDYWSYGKCALFILAGIALIVAGGQLVVNSSRKIAEYCGMSETLIGLTIVAVGTSLPELVTSVVAAAKKETGLAVGNVVGSNIFNMLFILGTSALINPVGVNLASVYDMIILLFASAFVYIVALLNRSITRVAGLIMILLYVADVIFAIVR